MNLHAGNISKTGKSPVQRTLFCADVGPKTLFAKVNGPRLRSLSRAVSVFELKRPIDQLPDIYDLKMGKPQHDAKLQYILSTKKELICHFDSIVDDSSWLNYTLPISDRIKDVFMLLNRLNIGFASFHLGTHKMKYENLMDKYPQLSHIFTREYYSKSLKNDFLGLFEERLEFLKHRYRGQIAFENAPYEEGSINGFICGNDFLNEMFYSFKDIYFLLDIAHASTCALSQGISTEDYLLNLPLKRIAQIHIQHAVGDKDFHHAPTKEEFDVLEFLLQRNVRPKYITIEYAGRSDVLLNSIDKLKRIISKY
jgi:uncharacterized protein (UPF0276 family)